MELELGLKFTRSADGFASDLQIAKDRAGPLFVSRETEAMFILTAHLKGYNRENIKIDINEDGTLIAVSGERRVKETVILAWKVINRDEEVKGFKEVFKIPKGVILDKIEAQFNEDESNLTVTMPKKVEGISGIDIEEIKEKDCTLTASGSSNQEKEGKTEKTDITESANETKQVRKRVTENLSAEDDHNDDEPKEAQKGLQEDVTEKHLNGQRSEIVEEPEDDIRERGQPRHDQVVVEKTNEIHDEAITDEKKGPFVVERAEEAKGNEAEEAKGHEPGRVQEEEQKNWGERFGICTPIVAGSALLLSFVVFVIHQVIRSKNQTTRRRG